MGITTNLKLSLSGILIKAGFFCSPKEILTESFFNTFKTSQDKNYSAEESYGEDAIQVLEGLEAVRKRPGMYIGDTINDGDGLIAIDGDVDVISITCQGFIDRIIDDLKDKVMKPCSVRLNFKKGVLQDRLVEKVQTPNGPVEVSPMHVSGATDRRGTEVQFLPDAEIFGTVDFHYEVLSSRLRELSFLNNGVKIHLADLRKGKDEVFQFAGGVSGFVDFINRDKTKIHDNCFYTNKTVTVNPEENINGRSRHAVDRRLHRKFPGIHKQYSSKRRRYACQWFKKCDDSRHQTLY